jgi:metal-responsive CopG/Arc/MetJ family transcriptional regulator
MDRQRKNRRKEPMEQQSFSAPPTLLNALDELADELDDSRSKLIRKGVEWVLREHGKAIPPEAA